VLAYLGRYTHRVAISNNRLVSLTGDQITFLCKDYKRGTVQRPMTLTCVEFIRRFLLHVLPDGFQHVRHYGFLGNRHREAKLTECRKLLGCANAACHDAPAEQDYRDRYEQLTGQSLRDCPACGRGHMLCIEVFAAGSLPRAPPVRLPS
jgi:hypothetical protein